MRLGVAGAGNMAAAMARGWSAGAGGPDEMVFCDLDAARARALADEVGGEVSETLVALRDRCDALLLAVKPAALDDVASELEGEAPPIISVMAATPLGRLQASFPGVPVLRVMPNQPVEVRSGVICHPPPAAGAEGLVALLEPLGEVHELAEDRIEAAMAVMSCAPAYVARFAQALAAAGEAEGLDAELSGALVRETVLGTARMLAGREPAQLMQAVAPPGGATEKGLEALEAGGMARAVEAAVEASLERFR